MTLLVPALLAAAALCYLLMLVITDSGKPAEASVCTIVAVLTFVICWIWFVIALAL